MASFTAIHLIQRQKAKTLCNSGRLLPPALLIMLGSELCAFRSVMHFKYKQIRIFSGGGRAGGHLGPLVCGVLQAEGPHRTPVTMPESIRHHLTHGAMGTKNRTRTAQNRTAPPGPFRHRTGFHSAAQHCAGPQNTGQPRKQPDATPWRVSKEGGGLAHVRSWQKLQGRGHRVAVLR